MTVSVLTLALSHRRGYVRAGNPRMSLRAAMDKARAELAKGGCGFAYWPRARAFGEGARDAREAREFYTDSPRDDGLRSVQEASSYRRTTKYVYADWCGGYVPHVARIGTGWRDARGRECGYWIAGYQDEDSGGFTFARELFEGAADDVPHEAAREAHAFAERAADAAASWHEADSEGRDCAMKLSAAHAELAGAAIEARQLRKREYDLRALANVARARGEDGIAESVMADAAKARAARESCIMEAREAWHDAYDDATRAAPVPVARLERIAAGEVPARNDDVAAFAGGFSCAYSV